MGYLGAKTGGPEMDRLFMQIGLPLVQASLPLAQVKTAVV